MPTYEITSPDGKTYDVTAPEGASQDQVLSYAKAHFAAQPQQQDTAQPSTLDRIIASPVGRFAQENVVAPALGLGTMLSHAVTNDPRVDTMQNAETGGYDAALARNRNTPGYAEARAEADKVASGMNTPGQNATDTLFKSFQPAIAGTVGMLGGLDTSNAMADAASQRLNAVQKRHPYLSPAAQILGGVGTGVPEMVPAQAASKLPATIPSALNAAVAPKVAQSAADYVGTIARTAGKTPDQIAQAAAEFGGKPVTAAEAIGRPGIGALAALGRRSGATPDALEGMLTERSMAAPSRMLEDFSQAAGIDPTTAEGNLQALVDSGRAKATPLYEQAYAQPPVITDRLNQFAQEPIVQQGMSRGIKIERLKALAEGRPFDPNAYAITGFNEAGDPIIGGVPTWKTWDAAKLGLDNMLESYRNQITGKVSLDKMGDAINSVRKSMLNELDAVNPAYKVARANAGDYLSAQSAFQRGQKSVFNNNVTESQFAKTLENLSPAELESFKGGAVNQINNLVQQGRLKPSLLATPRVRAKLVSIFGPEQAKTLISKATAEARLQLATNRMKPGLGSPTAELADAMNEQNGGINLPGMISAGKAGAHAAKGNLLGAASHGLDAIRHFSPRVGMMSVPVRDEAGRLLMMSPQELADYLKRLNPNPPIEALPTRPVPYGLIGSSGSLLTQNGSGARQ